MARLVSTDDALAIRRVPASADNSGQSSVAEIPRNAQNPSITYKTGTAQWDCLGRLFGTIEARATAGYTDIV
jgi:hypothetical protein